MCRHLWLKDNICCQSLHVLQCLEVQRNKNRVLQLQVDRQVIGQIYSYARFGVYKIFKNGIGEQLLKYKTFDNIPIEM